jgi:hypothetical protein
VYQPPSAPPPPAPPAYQPYQAAPTQGYQPYQQTPAAPAKSSNRTLFIVLGVVGGLLALCCIGGVAVFALYPAMLSSTSSGSDDPVVNQEPPIVDQPNNPGQPGGNSVDMPVGTSVDVTSGGDAYTIAITSATWRDDNCEENEFLPQPEGKLLVLDVTWEVTKGTASINPFFFEYVDSDGVTGDYSIFDGCDPALDAGNDLPAGSKRTGKVVFEVKGKTTGTVSYGDFTGAKASWTITG